MTIQSGTVCTFNCPDHPQHGETVTVISKAETGDRITDFHVYNGYEEGYHIDTPLLVDFPDDPTVAITFTLAKYLIPLDDNDSKKILDETLDKLFNNTKEIA